MSTHSPLPAVELLRTRIVAAQRSDGGWGAEEGRPSNTEATALTLLALSRARSSAASGTAPGDAVPPDAAARGLRWLTARQHAQGSWPATDQVPAPSWMTSVAVLALAATGAEPPAARRGAEWLLGQEGLRFDWRTRFALWLDRVRGEKTGPELDAQLKGWPWIADTFSWVEPTALAMLALRAMAGDPVLGRSRERTYRLQQGELLLVDRMVPSGGWNYGNSRVLGEDLEAYPDTTAWALLALRGTSRSAVIEASVGALVRLMAENSSPLARSLAVLALRAHGRDATALRDALDAQCAGPELPRDGRTRALALLALSSDAFPFDRGPVA